MASSIQPSSSQIETSEVEMPQGWKYKTLMIGPITLPWFASPEAQLILVSFVCFLCPGMFNALNGLGAGGGELSKDFIASDAANTALYATFAIVGFFAGSFVNTMGIRTSISFGGLGYCVYMGAFLSWKHTANFGYVVFSGFLLGCCASILWSAQGAIMMAYPPEHMKGRFISWHWVIFNSGAVLGNLIILGFNNDRKTPGSVTDSTYITIIVLTFFGACIALTLIDANHVVRRDGSRVILMQNPTWKSEIIGLLETLQSDRYIILLFPLFFTSNWFYTYQFQDVNAAQFNKRTRALNGVLYWLAQMFGALAFGYALDFPYVRRTTRAKIGWLAMFVLTFAVWGGGYVFQTMYNRQNSGDNSPKRDWTSDGYVGLMFLYISYGFYAAAWQTCVYWFMGAISNNSRKLANFAGFYKGIQSAGAAIMWSLDGYKIPYMNIFLSCWILLAGSLVVALPVILLKIKDTVPIEEDLKFVDETIEDLIPQNRSHPNSNSVYNEKVWRALPWGFQT